LAISSPVGVGIGIDASTQGRVADWIFAVSMGLATGIFIYVSINHLLSKGYKPRSPVAVDTPLGRWLAVVLGVAVIARSLDMGHLARHESLSLCVIVAPSTLLLVLPCSY
jgi:hypothetical protein